MTQFLFSLLKTKMRLNEFTRFIKLLNRKSQDLNLGLCASTTQTFSFHLYTFPIPPEREVQQCKQNSDTVTIFPLAKKKKKIKISVPELIISEAQIQLKVFTLNTVKGQQKRQPGSLATKPSNKSMLNDLLPFYDSPVAHGWMSQIWSCGQAKCI